MLCRALTFSETVYHFRQQLLVHRDLWYPFPPIKARKEGLHLDHLQSPAEWLKPCRVLAHALGHKLEAVPQEELPRSADTPPAETSPDGGPRSCYCRYILDQAWVRPWDRRLLSQVHEQRLPAEISTCYS